MRNAIALEVIDIPRPCPADWNAMHGNSKVRFCDHCQKNVYNLSAMTREAAEALVIAKEGKLCAQMYRRADGTVITADCGGGWKLRAKKLSRVLAGACAAILGGLLVPKTWAEPVPMLAGEIAVQVKGDVAPPPTTQPTTQPTENDGQPELIKGKVAAMPSTQPAPRRALPRPLDEQSARPGGSGSTVK